jgi:hypothetical protein
MHLQAIYIESPLLISLTESNRGLFTAVQEVYTEIQLGADFPALWYFAAILSTLTLDPSSLSRMRSKWVPTEGSHPYPNLSRDCALLLSSLIHSSHLSAADKEALVQVNPSDVAHAALVWRYNSFGHHTDPNALCMYDVTSMMAHACTPSAVWQFGENDSFCLRARITLQAGDEITISYLGEEDLIKAVSIRQQKTQGWMFSCACVKCHDQVLDFTRGFRCPTCANGTIFFCAKDKHLTSACTACNSYFDHEDLVTRSEYETQYAECLAFTDKTDFEDLSKLYKDSLTLFTHQHWVVYLIETYLTDILKSRSSPADLPRRTHLLHMRLQFLAKAYPVPNYTTGSLWEELGDCYLSLGAKDSACECFDTAYWTYRTLLGFDHPTAEAVYVKFLDS